MLLVYLWEYFLTHADDETIVIFPDVNQQGLFIHSETLI